MIEKENVRIVHVEASSRCNSQCPMCSRYTGHGFVQPDLAEGDLSVDVFYKLFTKEFTSQLEHVYFSGVYGDPCLNKKLPEFVKYLVDHGCGSVSIDTNGGYRNEEWWAELAQVIGKKGYVIFGLDGLEDTNHLYRQGTVWKKIMENARAFIAAGGRARWDYIVFGHNEHQVEEARALAESMGFEKFNIKKSNRFFSNTKGVVKANHQAGNRKGGTTQMLSMPTNPEYQNSALKQLESLSKDKGKVKIDFMTTVAELEGKIGQQKFNLDPAKKKDMEKYWDSVEIKCKVAEEKSIYITAEGYLQPCCWTAGQMYVWYWKEKGGQIWNAINEAGLDTLDLKQHSIKDVVEGKFMQEIIPNSWNKNSCAEGKLAVCAKTCGTKYDAFSEQFK